MDKVVILPFIFTLGLMVGSFLNVCIYRMPRDKSIVLPRSFCPNCGKTIAWFDNIPLISYIFLGGKCRNCKTSISYRYFLIELLTGLFFLLFFNYGFGRGGVLLGAIYLMFISALIVCTFIDFDFYVIPDVISVPGTVIGIVCGFLSPAMVGAHTHLQGLLTSFIGALAGGGALFAIAMAGEFILKKEAMGMGDVKLIAMIGAFVGWKLVLIAIFFASLLGSFVGLALIISKRADLQSKIPFGPYLCMGSILSIFFGGPMIDLYMSLMFRAI